MQGPAIAALVAATLAGACYLTIIGVLMRVTSGRHVSTIIVGVAALLLVIVPISARGALSFWHFAAFFGAAVSLIVFLYGAVLKSLSLAMLVAMAQAQDEQLSVDELADRVVRPAFAARARLLVELGTAVRDGAGYAMIPKGQQTANRIQAVRRFLRLDSLGLYGGITALEQRDAPFVTPPPGAAPER